MHAVVSKQYETRKSFIFYNPQTRRGLEMDSDLIKHYHYLKEFFIELQPHNTFVAQYDQSSRKLSQWQSELPSLLQFRLQTLDS